MSAIFRAAEASEMAEVVRLWDQVFKVGEPFFTSLLEADPTISMNQTQVAVEDGRIVSSVQFFLRRCLDSEGRTRKVGGIGSVSTLEEARGKGYSAELLKRSIAEMRDCGCDLSMLFTGINPHYAKHGWRTIETCFRAGTVRMEGAEPSHDIRRVEFDAPGVRQALAKLYEEFNARRPLAHIRSDRDWETAVRYRFAQPGTMLWAAYEGETLVGYAMARPGWKNVLSLAEVGADPARSRLLLDVGAAIRADCAAAKIPNLTVSLPFEPAVDAMVEALLSNVELRKATHIMAMALEPKMSEASVDALFAAPGAHYWEADGF